MTLTPTLHTCTDPDICYLCLRDSAFTLAVLMDFDAGKAREHRLRFYQDYGINGTLSEVVAENLKRLTIAACEGEESFLEMNSRARLADFTDQPTLAAELKALCEREDPAAQWVRQRGMAFDEDGLVMTGIGLCGQPVADRGVVPYRRQPLLPAWAVASVFFVASLLVWIYRVRH